MHKKEVLFNGTSNHFVHKNPANFVNSSHPGRALNRKYVAREMTFCAVYTWEYDVLPYAFLPYADLP